MNEARISLTPKCNYKCFFCHNEGIQLPKYPRPQLEQLQLLVRQLMENGYDDLTFTGGEPFLYGDVLVQTVQWIQKTYRDRLPAITLVTNGSLVQPEQLKILAKYPRLKIHVSLHTAFEKNYAFITGQGKFPLTRARQTIQTIARLKIPFKINYVLLRDVNTGERDILTMLDFASQQSALAVKFLELLVMEQNEYLYPYFYDIRSLEQVIQPYAQLEQVVARRKTYRYNGSELKLELQRLTCKLGCRNCLKNRDQTFTADLKYFPCMEASDEFFSLKKNRVPELLKLGKKTIARLVQEYGEGSPSLLQDTRYVDGRREMFFRISEKQAQALVQSATKLERQHFEEWFYRPRTADEDWFRKQRVIKIRRHFTDEKNAKIYGATVFLETQDGITYQRTVYFDQKQEMFTGELSTARRFLEGMDMISYLYADVELEKYRLEKATFTIGRVNGKSSPILGVDVDSFSDYSGLQEWLTEHRLPFTGTHLVELLEQLK